MLGEGIRYGCGSKDIFIGYTLRLYISIDNLHCGFCDKRH